MTSVTNKQDSRRERKKAAIRDRIITEGIRLFSRHGIAGVTVEQIAEAADIGKGTIYNYFQTKEDIVVAHMVNVERRVQAKLRRFARSRAPLHSILSDFLLSQLRQKASDHEFARVFLAHMFLHREQFFPTMVELQKVVDPPLEELFRSLQKRGAIRPDVSLPDLIIDFKTIHLGLTAFWVIEGPPFKETEKAVRRQMQLFSKGLEAPNDR